MAFTLMLLYTAMSLLSPGVLPDEIVRLRVNEILGCLTIVTMLPKMLKSNLLEIPEVYLGFGLIASTAISTMATGWIGGALSTIMGFIPIVITFYFITITCTSLFRVRILISVLSLVALFIFTQGLFAYYTGHFESPYLLPEGVSGEILYRYRGLGVLSDPNDLAQFYVMVIPLLWIRWTKSSFAKNFVFTIVPSLVLVIGIGLTHSRGGLIALLAVLFVGFRKSLGVVASSALAAIASTGVVMSNLSGGRGMNDDDGGRIASWSTGFQLVKSHPLFGVGVGNFADYNSTGLTAHNSYILAFAELGMLGYFFWIGMIICGWKGLSGVLEAGSHTDVLNASPSLLSSIPQPFAKQKLTASKLVRQDAGALPDVSGYIGNRAHGVVIERDEDVARAARLLQVSLVGLLTASIFLSRTYSMPLYVLLGVAVAVRRMARVQPSMELSLLLRWIVLAVLISITLTYLFVRIRGSH